MLNQKLLRRTPEVVKDNLQRRGVVLDIAYVQSLDQARSELQEKTQALQARRNQAAKAVGQAKARSEDIQPLLDEVAGLSEALKAAAAELQIHEQAWTDYLYTLPNLIHDTVPAGESEADNQIQYVVGEQPTFDFAPLDHVALGDRLQQIDFEAGAKLSGARFVVLKRQVAQLHRALAQFMLDLHVESHGYEECYVPYLVSPEMLYGTGQLPKFEDKPFSITGERELYLIPTAEVPLANLLHDTIVDVSSLPLRYVAHTPCFRSEAGSYGKDVKGLIRQHQFDKVEMVQWVHPDEGEAALSSLLSHAEAVLTALDLPYQVTLLCAGDTGFTAMKTYDLEVWMPGQGAYREISSCSYCGDFQARRMKARYRDAAGKPQLLHSLNGSGLAVGRTLIAVMENYQDAAGNIHIPEVLQPYLQGQTIITAGETG
jgi:seryl-tRNA synthetase